MSLQKKVVFERKKIMPCNIQNNTCCLESPVQLISKQQQELEQLAASQDKSLDSKERIILSEIRLINGKTMEFTTG